MPSPKPISIPSASPPQFINTSLANSQPELYGALLAANPTPEEYAIAQTLLSLNSLNDRLNKNPDLHASRKEFANLEPVVRRGLQFMNPGADYQTKSPSLFSSGVNIVANKVTSPFRGVIDTAEDWIKGTNLAYKIYRGFLDTGKTDKEAFEYILNKKSWSDAFNGKNQWDEVSNDRLTEKHGYAMTFLVKGIIEGRTPSEIIKEYGDISADGGEFEDAFRKWSNGDEAYKSAFAEYKAYQINPGNDLTNWANNNHPPSDGGVWSYMMPVALAVTHPLSAVTAVMSDNAVVIADKKLNQWKVKNPNPFGADEFVSPSGEINAVYQLAIDPLTYLTAGSSKAMLKAEKLAETFIATSKNNGSIQAVRDLSLNPAWAAKQNRLVESINNLREARAAGSDVDSAFIRTEISNNFPDAGSELIQRLLTVKVRNEAEKLVPITDYDSLLKFYELGENTKFVINSKLQGNMYYRENHVMLERRTRKTTDGMRSLSDQIFNGIDRQALKGNRPIPNKVFETADAFDEYFSVPIEQRLDNKIVNPKTDEVIAKLDIQKKNILRRLSKLAARKPEDVMLYTVNDLMYKSEDALRQYFRLIADDKLQANILLERYFRVTPDERLHMLASVYKLYTDKIGLTAIPEGVAIQRATLEQMYGINRQMGPVPFKTPAHLLKEGVVTIPPGASRISHTTLGISMPNFYKIATDIYEVKGLRKGLLRHASLNGLTNNPTLKAVNDGSIFFMLVPKIGGKASIDDAITLLSVTNVRNIYATFAGKGSGMHNALMGYTGSESTQGYFKSRYLDLIKRNPAKSVSSAERKAMNDMVKVEDNYMYQGREVQSSYLMSADEFYGASAEMRLAHSQLAKFAKLSPEEAEDMATHFVNNGHAAEGLIKSTVSNSFADTMVKGTIAEEIFGKSVITEAAEAYGVKSRLTGKPKGLRATGKYQTDEYYQLTAYDRAVVHHKEFYIAFGKNKWTTPMRTVVDFGSLFIKYNASRTLNDSEQFVKAVMKEIGWVRKNDTYILRGHKVQEGTTGQTSISTKMSERSTREFNSKFLQTTALAVNGKTPAQITEGIVRNMRDEMYTLFHGADTGFNEDLLKYINGKIDAASAKIVKSEDWMSMDAARRRQAGVRPMKKTERSQLDYLKYKEEILSPSHWVRETPIDEFIEATHRFPLSGKITTDYDFPVLPDSVIGHFKKFQNMGWQVMQRQIDDFVRSDAYLIKILEQRKIMRPFEKQMVEDLVKEGSTTQAAKLQANLYFDNSAADNAINELLKYADNPNVRSAFSWNMRGIGRFMRATEDYTRRMIRYLVLHPDKVIYRTGHLSTAMSGTGMVYDDDNGNQYVLVPNDGILWHTIAPVFAAMMNPLRALPEIASGNWDFFKQPEWNASTLKISMMNPSYSDGAGLFTLTGPTMAIPVLLSKQILGLSDNPTIKTFSENLDNILLGQQSDDVGWIRALVPSALTNTWKQLDTNNQTAIGASTMMQAAAILQSHNNTKLKPEDYGNEAKMNLYIERLKTAAFNMIAIKSAFNTYSVAPMGSADPLIPNELRKMGIISMNQEFSDILRGVLDNNAKYGYNFEDPVGLATSMFVGDNPDKLVFTISRNSKSAQLAITNTAETKAWIIKNPKLLKEYGDVAFPFAPRIGEYSPSAARFLETTGLINGKDNPFEANNAVLKKYVTTLAAAVVRNEYYNVDREVARTFADPNNPDRNRPGYRQEVLDNAKIEKKRLLNSSIPLQRSLGTSEVVQREALQIRFERFDQMINDPKFKGVIDAGAVFTLTSQIMPATKRVIRTFEDTNVRKQVGGQTALDDNLTTWHKRIKEMVAGNPILSETYRSILAPYIDDLYRIPTSAMNRNK
jgi:hypothetical protein